MAVLNGSDTGPAFYRERRPVTPHPLVACWWEQRAGTGESVQRVVPDACADVIVWADGRVTVVGPATGADLVRLPAGQHLWSLRFRPSAIGAALGVPAHELRDREVPLTDLFPAASAARITAEVRRGVWPSFLDDGAYDPRVRHALRGLAGDAGVAAVAADLDLSERHLRRLVLTHTGLDPRTFQRVARFQRFLALAERTGEGGSLAGLAARAGYADQAHLSRETRALSGLTPSALLAERRGTPG